LRGSVGNLISWNCSKFMTQVGIGCQETLAVASVLRMAE